MKHVIRKGQEHKLCISKNVNDTSAFMYPSYLQAFRALGEIISHANDFDPNNLCQELYSYAQNVITFTAKRGQGKTSTMVSFATALKEGKLHGSAFNDCAFQVLPPIDPTIMEDGQNILSLILSRMYRLAEEKWCGRCGSNAFSGSGPSEVQKNELLKKFQDCLSGINAIKSHDDAGIKSLTDISLISDSSLLKQNIYLLTGDLLRFVSDNSIKAKRFLVIQLDDTDFQISKGYEIMEDIRKFFSVPNIIILMATDMTMLRSVILKHYKDAFKNSDVPDKELVKLESKYIDKIVPPLHAIHLPRLDENIVRFGDSLIVRYQEGEEETEENNVLLNKEAGEKEEHFNAQELLLRYIYRKTGIIFVASQSYYHRILPTSLRGMAQLLALLSTMDDIPEIKTKQQTGPELRDEMKTQVSILETNLPRFEKYFLNEWAHAKLHREQVDILNGLANEAADNWIGYIARVLEDPKNQAKKSEEQETLKLKNYDYVSLSEFLDEIVNDNPDMHLFVFAIRTCFTILHHKTMVKQMRKAVDNYKEGWFTVDFAPVMNHLPTTFYVPEKHYDGGIALTGDFEYDTHGDEAQQLAIDCLIQKVWHKKELKQSINVMSLLNVALALGKANKLNMIVKTGEDIQSWLYQIQQAAMCIVPNWEVRELSAKVFNETRIVLHKERRQGCIDEWPSILSKLEERVKKINASSENSRPMLVCKLIELNKIITSNEHTLMTVKTIFEKYCEQHDSSYIAGQKWKTLTIQYAKAVEFKTRLARHLINRGDEQAEALLISELESLITSWNKMYTDNKQKGVWFDRDFINEVIRGSEGLSFYERQVEEKFKSLCEVLGLKFEYIKEEKKEIN